MHIFKVVLPRCRGVYWLKTFRPTRVQMVKVVCCDAEVVHYRTFGSNRVSNTRMCGSHLWCGPISVPSDGKSVRCIHTGEYSTALTRGAIYRHLPDVKAENHGTIRIIDNSGESYLYPRNWFEVLPEENCTT